MLMVLLRCLTDFSFISAEFEMLYLATWPLVLVLVCIKQAHNWELCCSQIKLELSIYINCDLGNSSNHRWWIGKWFYNA